MTRHTDNPGPWRLPSRLFSAMRAARRRYPDGSLGPDYFTVEDAAAVLQVPITSIFDWASDDGPLDVVQVDGRSYIDALSVARFVDTGSVTVDEHVESRLHDLQQIALLHPAGLAVGWRTILFPGGITDAEWEPRWDPERQVLRCLLDGPDDREVYRRLMELACIGQVPVGDEGDMATTEDFAAAWDEHVATLDATDDA